MCVCVCVCFQRLKQYKIQKHLLLKNRNDYLLGIARCNSLQEHYFSVDIEVLVEVRGHTVQSLQALMCVCMCVHVCNEAEYGF